MLIYRRVTPNIKFARAMRGTVRVKCLAQEHNRLCLRAGLEARSLDPETRTLNTRLPSLHEGSILLYKIGLVSQAVFLIGKIDPITSELKISNFIDLKESALLGNFFGLLQILKRASFRSYFETIYCITMMEI